jgi:putative tricarboxylic transport membrane protein
VLPVAELIHSRWPVRGSRTVSTTPADMDNGQQDCRDHNELNVFRHLNRDPSAGAAETFFATSDNGGRQAFHMTRHRWVGMLAAVAVAALATAGCGTTGKGDTGGGAANQTITGLRLMVPNTPGSGYDVTARAAAKAMEDSKIARNIEVFNLAGAGGTVALQRLVNEKGNKDLTMMMGLGVVGAVYTNKSKATLADSTPLARVIEEPGGIFVPKDSPYKTLNDLISAWKANPGKVSVGGGSSPGGPDHLLPMQLAQAVGINPKTVNYVGYDGGGELLPAILGGKVAFGASGYGEFLDQVKAGQLRMLAVTSEQRVKDPKVGLQDVPTLKEQGVDLVFTNWRGIVAAPGISDADKRKLIGALDRMHDSEQWKKELENRGWTDAYLSGDKFADFLKEQDRRVADVLTKLGLS